MVWVRTDLAAQTFSKIRDIKPERLYIAVDGPRNADDKVRIEKTLKALNVDWDCDVKYLIRDKNLGCNKAVTEAITWFFEQEEMGIILEDDCCPDLSFFPYCKDLLNKYKDDTRIMTIGGFCADEVKSDYSYYFGKLFSCWGWATWRRAWKYFDINMADYDLFKKENAIEKFVVNRVERRRLLNEFEKTHKYLSWDWIFLYNLLCQNSLHVLPCVNLVNNIGANAEFSVHDLEATVHPESVQMQFPLKHPHFVGVENFYNNPDYLLYYRKLFKRKLLMIISKLFPRKIKIKIRSYIDL